MIDADRLLGRVLNSGAASGFLGGVLGGGAAGMLGSRKGRKLAKSALKLGGVAAVGALAYHAYTRYRAGQDGAGSSPGAPDRPGDARSAASSVPAAASPVIAGTGAPDRSAPSALAPPPPGSGFLPAAEDADAMQSLGVVLIRSMIAAARADGEIDAEEGRRLFSQMDRLDLEPEEKTFLLGELTRPVDLDAIVSAATTPQLAAEIYAASRMAIDVSDPAESAYLQMLASRLRLEPGLVAELDRAVASRTMAGADAGP